MTKQTTWDAAQRKGSKGIFVWESTDLISWVNERLVVVEDNTAGMVWAPEAIWDPAKGQYLVHWASKFVCLSCRRFFPPPYLASFVALFSVIYLLPPYSFLPTSRFSRSYFPIF